MNSVATSKEDELLASSSLRPNPHSAIVPLRSVRRDPNNAKRHDDKQVRLIASSMERFGFLAPIVIDESGMIVAGDGRYLAAKLLGLKQVPVVRARFLTEEDRTAYALADNKLAELSPWKDDVLAKQLNDLVAKNYDFGITGFGLSDIDFSIPGENVAEETEAVELPQPDDTAISRRGDLWLIGEHRLFCGDSQRAESFEQALGGELARLVCSDPPYGVKIKHNVSTKANAREFVMMSGEQTSPELIAFFRAAFRNCARFSHEASIHYHFIDWRNFRHMLDAADGVYEEFKQLLVWDKGSGALGAFYRSRHELICVFKSGQGKHINNFRMGETGRYRTNVLEHPGCSTFSKTRQRDLADHPSVKPTALIADLLLDCSNPGDVVLDAFCGSGTLLLAAAKVGRRGVGIELDPLYVDTALRRLRDATGIVATLAGDGRTFDEIAAERLAVTEGVAMSDDDYDDAHLDDGDELEGEDPGAPEASSGDYTVGYKKPPRHSQFRKCQSGNPRGRKKGSRGLKTDLHAELNRVLEVKMGSYRFKGTTQQLMLRGLALLAANGNLKASAQLVPLILTVFGTEDRGADKRTLSPNDQAVLDNFLAAFGGVAGDEEDPEESEGQQPEVVSDREQECLPAPDADDEFDETQDDRS